MRMNQFGKLKTASREIVEGFVSLFYPPYCLACNGFLVKGEDTICSGCILELPRSLDHLEKENTLFQKLSGRLNIEHASAFFIFRKQGKIQKLMHAFKYRGHPEIGVLLGKIYAKDLQDIFIRHQWDYIVPVPLHCSKKQKRGFNQSAEFGKGLSEVLVIPCLEDGLIRSVFSSTQTTKSRLSRWQNVKDIFEVRDPTTLRGKRILLVDDIATTGATLEACGATLFESGISTLSIACLARAK